ncbi:response regulator transcription factor [Aneurinibacillus aneurinilyticus]|uniref:Response regulator transcription factor n=2 Tax=Aneurinibacillus aneurinilyticus TaxID=1391 RepID=A0A848D0I8_ANEAE|nr:response regulator transcription factor [Aneurinibacillus aneurinilyticus]ERI08616.1 alkaline phosphatase synthesis transcriptional regulatory protein PhoP [Aneurinibacillus aneurinilyticus ATCC 12856]MED0672381.1 response regulator transcription factor [Aneurinibacillus aneurinilyticus]MED0706141.1 response regulator transcription factor [Aneurinibacillus aneurinilyticus]MED0725115.1 response regulator transcription factor [Aneurinibacillus aneurinilyticus]MED0732715.1 response regulator t
MKKILVVDDEQSIVTLLEFNLQKAGFEVIKTGDGPTAVTLAETEKPDLIVLDIMLPGMDGMEVCKKLRMEKINTPILMLTAKDEEFDKILGLELGADDYMTKPFSPREVVARVKAILRRSGQQQEPKSAGASDEQVITIGQLVIYPEKYEVVFSGNKLELTPKEFELLQYMASHPGRVMTRDQLLNAVWNYDFVGDSRIVDVHISHLREKIEEDTKQPKYIKTVRGLGYKLEG